MAKPKSTVTEYRSYYLPIHFPVLLLSGDYWKISDIPSGRLHFHNCLEIGICHSHSGYIEIFGEQILFQAGDVTVIPKNVPHTTYSMPGTESHWSYIYLDPKELFRNMLPATWKNYDLTGYSPNNFSPILHREEFRHPGTGRPETQLPHQRKGTPIVFVHRVLPYTESGEKWGGRC